jgi:hypothetical protein
VDYKQIIYDSYSVYELVDILLELGIMSKEDLIEDYWDDIEEELDEFLPFDWEEEEEE